MKNQKRQRQKVTLKTVTLLETFRILSEEQINEHYCPFSVLKQLQQPIDSWLKPFLFRINSSMIQNNSIVLLILRNPPAHFSPTNPSFGDQVINFYTVDAQLTSTNSKFNKRSAELRDRPADEESCNKNVRKFPKCRKPGKFSVLNTNCKEYIYCTRGNAKWFVDVFRCPEGYFFKPKLGHCTKDYLCKEPNNCEGNTTMNLEDSQYVCENGLKIELPECDWLTSGRVPIKGIYLLLIMIARVVNCYVSRRWLPEVPGLHGREGSKNQQSLLLRLFPLLRPPIVNVPPRLRLPGKEHLLLQTHPHRTNDPPQHRPELHGTTPRNDNHPSAHHDRLQPRIHEMPSERHPNRTPALPQGRTIPAPPHRV